MFPSTDCSVKLGAGTEFSDLVQAEDKTNKSSASAKVSHEYNLCLFIFLFMRRYFILQSIDIAKITNAVWCFLPSKMSSSRD